ncbi:MerR family transcriptional regulator [Nocardia sp. NPDC049149]|uniref:MerR family transcriptional regulator n=1 Tax=Nocardia sp. NPDC049149 TaxID=3364315 RepID=UPI0037158A38
MRKGVIVGWSTRELAELAGTSLRTVRHYHDIGLLAEPERRANGYKSYGVAHLVRVLRIKRLTGLGLSLAQIAEMDDTDAQPAAALRELDAELAETIDRLQRVRAEIAQVLSNQAAIDLPSEFATAAADVVLSGADRSLMFVLARLLGPDGTQAMTAALANYPSSRAFADLPADADEQARADLAKRMLVDTRQMYADHPHVRNLIADSPRGQQFAANTLTEALFDLYNPAQIDVLVRVGSELPTPADLDRP